MTSADAGSRSTRSLRGPVATDFSDGLLRDNEPVQHAITSLTALGRYAVADDIGSAIARVRGCRQPMGHRAAPRGLRRNQPLIKS
jgi:hypothetical protein